MELSGRFLGFFGCFYVYLYCLNKLLRIREVTVLVLKLLVGGKTKTLCNVLMMCYTHIDHHFLGSMTNEVIFTEQKLVSLLIIVLSIHSKRVKLA